MPPPHAGNRNNHRLLHRSVTVPRRSRAAGTASAGRSSRRHRRRPPAAWRRLWRPGAGTIRRASVTRRRWLALPGMDAMAQVMSLEDGELTYDQLVAARGELSAVDLVARLQDGRGVVRANALLGLAAIGHTDPEVHLFLRDAD